MGSAKIFLSHTDRGESDKKATTAFLVELRRVGLDVWIDRENPAPEATQEQQDAGATPENPLFNHIVSALKECDAVLFVCSEASFNREYVRLEFDPRILFQQFMAQHPGLPIDQIPFYAALVQPIRNPTSFWTYFTDIVTPGRILNLSDPGTTPLLLPTVLNNLIREIAPDHLLPLNPVEEWFARSLSIDKGRKIDGCPAGIQPEVWLRFEHALGLGPLFPGKYDTLDEAQLRYAIFRIGDTSRILSAFETMIGPQPEISDHLALWTANAALRSREMRIFNGRDFSVEFSLPGVMRDAGKRENKELYLASALQYGYALLTSETVPNFDTAASVLIQAREMFLDEKAYPLAALAEILGARACNDKPSAEAKQLIKAYGCDADEPDLMILHHNMLDAIFPGPRVESTPEYRSNLRISRDYYLKAAGELKSRFAKIGESEFNPEY